MKDKVIEEIQKKTINGKIPCPIARKIAKDLSVSYKEVGRVANELNVKITDCELGCF
jgi:LAO/AO transport system kinase